MRPDQNSSNSNSTNSNNNNNNNNNNSNVSSSSTWGDGGWEIIVEPASSSNGMDAVFDQSPPPPVRGASSRGGNAGEQARRPRGLVGTPKAPAGKVMRTVVTVHELSVPSVLLLPSRSMTAPHVQRN
jgi:hypothetical protein